MRRLLLTLAEPPERFAFRLAWSAFRRRHQARAKQCHAARRARCLAPSAPTIQVLSSSDFTLTDAQWTRIAPVLPPQKPPTGRPPLDHRTVLAGIFWVIRTGASWRQVPEQFGPWQTINTRYQRWRQTGIWQQILDALSQDESSDGAS